MSDKTVPANTPETLGVTPRYVLQHNAISRSAHNFSATAKKLTAMAMALLPADLSNLTVAFTFTEFCKALGYTKSGESFKIFLTALKECLNNVISLEIVSPTTGKKKWENYTWFTASVFDEETGVATMTFSPKFAAALQDLKRVYAKIHLQDLGELQSKYALRIFEMAVSYESLKGKDGNKSESWYFERSIPELRFMFGIPEDAYPETKRFRQKVIEEPVEEINQAGIGVKIKTEGIKQGRRLAALRFNCEKAARTIPAKKRGRSGKKAESQLELPDQNPAKARQEKELEHLKELYP
ncbi:MAG: replication initiation protein, partial [Treponema sp.]|nr:replication initiation protein [Treponema sp.]